MAASLFAACRRTRASNPIRTREVFSVTPVRRAASTENPLCDITAFTVPHLKRLSSLVYVAGLCCFDPGAAGPLRKELEKLRHTQNKQAGRFINSQLLA